MVRVLPITIYYKIIIIINNTEIEDVVKKAILIQENPKKTLLKISFTLIFHFPYVLLASLEAIKVLRLTIY